MLAVPILILANKVFKDRVLVYYSGYPRTVPFDVQKQLCSFTRPPACQLKFDLMNVMVQPNSFFCGVLYVPLPMQLKLHMDTFKEDVLLDAWKRRERSIFLF